MDLTGSIILIGHYLLYLLYFIIPTLIAIQNGFPQYYFLNITLILNPLFDRFIWVVMNDLEYKSHKVGTNSS